MGIKELSIKLIERTEDPTAPIKVQALAMAVESIGPMLAGLSSQEQVEAYNDRLLSRLSDEELERIKSDPNFLLALLGNVSVALKAFVHS